VVQIGIAVSGRVDGARPARAEGPDRVLRHHVARAIAMSGRVNGVRPARAEGPDRVQVTCSMRIRQEVVSLSGIFLLLGLHATASFFLFGCLGFSGRHKWMQSCRKHGSRQRDKRT